MVYSTESYLDVLNYNIRKYILNQDVKLEDDRDANNLLKNQFLHPEELQEAIIKLLNIESLQELLSKPENLIYNELEFFKSNDLTGKIPAFYNSINHCESRTGDAHLKSIFSHTITNIPILEERKYILQYFNNYLNLDEKNYLQSTINGFKNDENALYWNITPKKPEMEEIFNILYFNQPWSKFLNFKKEFVNLFYYFLIIFIPIWGIIGPLCILLVPYLVTNLFLKIPIPLSFYLNQLKNILFGQQLFGILKMCQKGYNLFMMSGGGQNGNTNNKNNNNKNNSNPGNNIKVKAVNFIMDLITGKLGQLVYCIIIIGGYFWNIYNAIISSRNFNKLINFLHTRINCLKTLLTSVNTLLSSDILKKGDNLNIIETHQFKEVAKECNTLLNDNDYIKFILNTNTFSQTPNIISHKGNVIYAYYILDKNEEYLKPFIKFMALIDTWYSSSKLLSQGFNPSNFILNNKPRLKLAECFSPVLGNNGVCNDCILGYENNDNLHLGKEDKVGEDKVGEDKCNTENKSNCLLTGPNGSGKSSYLKTVMSSIICSQTLGLAPVKYGELTPFHHLSTYLNIPDCQGKESLFQAEMNRCYQHLEKCKKLEEEGLPSFHIMDEIFVSTNFLEGLSGAYAVVNYLQKFNHSMHIITTHFDKLVEQPFDKYQLKHFTIDEVEDTTTENGETQLLKDYKLRDGKNEKHLALHLLKCKGFNEELLTDAKKMYNELTLPTPDVKDNKSIATYLTERKEISTQTHIINNTKKVSKVKKNIKKNNNISKK